MFAAKSMKSLFPKLVPNRKEYMMSGDNGRKNLMHFMMMLIAVAIFLILSIVYIGIDSSKRAQAYQTSELLVEQIKNVLDTNETKQQSLIDSLKENYIAKAKAVSYIVDRIPGTESDIAELARIAKLMAIDEIHLFNTHGTIYAGTVQAYYGLNFDSGEQMAFFKPMLSDKMMAMCQDVMPNTAESKPMMYAICWNDAGTRMTQIGIEPRRLLEEMKNSEISEIIYNMPTYDGVDIFVADKKTGLILGSSVPRDVQRTLSEVGLNIETPGDSAVHEQMTYVGRNISYCSYCVSDEYLIGVIQKRDAINKDMPGLLLMVFFFLLVSALVIGLIVKHMTNRIIEEHINANIDVMTGFLNRRVYEEDMKEAERAGMAEDFVYVSIDINDLKEVNDTFGHEEGDNLIIGAAGCMKKAFGDYGKIYRIGGDEFVALINVSDVELKGILRNYAVFQQRWSERSGRELSTACGFVAVREDANRSIVDMARLADKRMYEEKAKFHHGRG